MQAGRWRLHLLEPAENVGRLLSVNHKGAAWSGLERRHGERSQVTQMSRKIFAVLGPRDLAASRSAQALRTQVTAR